MSVNYHKYIRSDEWRAKADRLKEERGRKCQVCGKRDVQLDTHHNTYDRLGDELGTDLVVLCRSCHELYHSDSPSNMRCVGIIEREDGEWGGRVFDVAVRFGQKSPFPLCFHDHEGALQVLWRSGIGGRRLVFDEIEAYWEEEYNEPLVQHHWFDEDNPDDFFERYGDVTWCFYFPKQVTT